MLPSCRGREERGCARPIPGGRDPSMHIKHFLLEAALAKVHLGHSHCANGDQKKKKALCLLILIVGDCQRWGGRTSGWERTPRVGGPRHSKKDPCVRGRRTTPGGGGCPCISRSTWGKHPACRIRTLKTEERKKKRQSQSTGASNRARSLCVPLG